MSRNFLYVKHCDPDIIVFEFVMNPRAETIAYINFSEFESEYNLEKSSRALGIVSPSR